MFYQCVCVELNVENVFELLKKEKERQKKGKVTFNDALNTFYLVFYGVKLMVKDYSDSERGNPLLSLHWLLLLIRNKIAQHIPQPLLHQLWRLAGMRNSSMGPPLGLI